MDDGTRFQFAEGVNYQALGEQEEGVLLSMGSGYLYRCNPTAIAVFASLEARPTLGELVEQLAARWRQPAERMREDLTAFLHELIEEKIVEAA